MIGFLIEHYAGAFPPWLAPVQVMVLPIAERHQEYGAKVLGALKAAGIRAELTQDQTLNYRIRSAQKQKIPFMMVLGDREVEDSQVAIRLRSGDNMDPMRADAAVAMIAAKIATRAAE